MAVRLLEGVTEVWPISAEEVRLEHPGIRRAASVLRSGELVAFPTETVYALGGLARLPEALARIYAAKGRPQGKPLSLLVRDREMAEAFVDFSPTAERLWEAFAPGPLTLILPVRPGVRLAAVRGLRGAAVRSPDHPVAQVLLQAVGEPIAAPSANRSARPSPTRAEDVLRDFAGSLPLLLDGGETSLGFESTIVDLCGDVPRLVREGAVPAEAVAEVLGQSLRPAEDSVSSSGKREGKTSSSLVLKVHSSSGKWRHQPTTAALPTSSFGELPAFGGRDSFRIADKRKGRRFGSPSSSPRGTASPGSSLFRTSSSRLSCRAEPRGCGVSIPSCGRWRRQKSPPPSHFSHPKKSSVLYANACSRRPPRCTTHRRRNRGREARACEDPLRVHGEHVP
ncbi:MAG: threonylcarbamoyl-AMP synthase [Brockia lithotrophica]|nr:threonylcarbamoyl-AMP synthase [Brockia lithotrophica]